mmetsp:Transcript_39957/g.71901  ORF Transcript_39957/g.71901 Transcript_39957/m.71901 type:complete len:92 (-) Transcript_39957:544-819(-)
MSVGSPPTDTRTLSETLNLQSPDHLFQICFVIFACFRVHQHRWHRVQLIPSLQPLGLYANLHGAAHVFGWPIEPTEQQPLAAASKDIPGGI